MNTPAPASEPQDPASTTRKTRRLPVPVLAALAALVLASAPATAQTAARSSSVGVQKSVTSDHPYVPGEVLVQFRRGTGPVGVRSAVAVAGATEVRAVSAAQETFLARTRPSDAATRSLVRELERRDDVVAVSLNYIGRGGAASSPSDPYFADQWHLEQNTDIDLDATDAWSVASEDNTIVVAVLDSGVVLDHAELNGRFFQNPGEIADNGIDDDGNGYVDDVSGWDFVRGDNAADDEHGHGTQVTMVLAANDDDQGTVGLDWQARILPLKVLNDANEGTMADLIAALDYVASRTDIDFVNLSLVDFPQQPLLDEALTRAARRSIVVSCAGNGGAGTASYQFPGAHPDTISVGATNRFDEVAAFSSTGASVFVTAPGEDIVFSDPASPSGDGILQGQGCSYATPLVTGIGSLAKALWSEMDAADFRELLRVSAVDLGPAGRDDDYGYGRVSAGVALALAAEVGGPLDDDEPEVIVVAPADPQASGQSPRTAVRRSGDS